MSSYTHVHLVYHVPYNATKHIIGVATSIENAIKICGIFFGEFYGAQLPEYAKENLAKNQRTEVTGYWTDLSIEDITLDTARVI